MVVEIDTIELLTVKLSYATSWHGSDTAFKYLSSK